MKYLSLLLLLGLIGCKKAEKPDMQNSGKFLTIPLDEPIRSEANSSRIICKTWKPNPSGCTISVNGEAYTGTIDSQTLDRMAGSIANALQERESSERALLAELRWCQQKAKHGPASTTGPNSPANTGDGNTIVIDGKEKP